MASWHKREVTNEHILPYVDSASAPPDVKAALQTLPFERNIFKLLANAPNYFAAYMNLLSRNFASTKALLPSEWQMTILTTAVSLDAPYEWDVNAPLAKLLDWPEEKFACIRDRSFASSQLFTSRERIIAKLVLEIAHSDRASEGTMKVVKDNFTDAEIVEIFMVHGTYALIARLMNSARIDFDEPIEGLEEMLAKTFEGDIKRDREARVDGKE